MRVYQISLFDANWRTINVDYMTCEDRQAAEWKAERDADWLGAAHYEVTRIR